eukprot:1258413-Amphidinium_carterae.1
METSRPLQRKQVIWRIPAWQQNLASEETTRDHFRSLAMVVRLFTQHLLQPHLKTISSEASFCRGQEFLEDLRHGIGTFRHGRFECTAGRQAAPPSLAYLTSMSLRTTKYQALQG